MTDWSLEYSADYTRAPNYDSIMCHYAVLCQVVATGNSNPYGSHRGSLFLIKSVIDRKCPTCRNNNRLQTRQRPWTGNGESFWTCVSLDIWLYLAKPSTTIDHSALVEKWHLELQTGEHKQTDGQTDVTKRIISPASWSITSCDVHNNPYPATVHHLDNTWCC